MSDSGNANGVVVCKTPQRNNYAAPHTPIASAKRPRQSGVGANGTPRTTPSKQLSDSVIKSPSGRRLETHPEDAVTSHATTDMSPMHPPRPVVRDEAEQERNENSDWSVTGQVGALFSPVLSFLSPGGSSKDELEEGASEEAAQITDEGEENYEETSEKGETEDEDVRMSEAEVPPEHIPQDATEDEEDEFNPYLFIKSLPNYEHVQHLTPPVALPPKDQPTPGITLVLDLDETLCHATVEPIDDADLVFPVVFHGMQYQVHVRLRPHLYDFLEAVCTKFEVVVFTASQKVYADELLDRIDPQKKYIQHRMFRDSCLAVEGNFLKDLTVLGRDLKQAVLVDNSPHAFGYQYDNGIPIESWFDDPNDTELLKLRDFLIQDLIASGDDVRPTVRRKFETYIKVREA